jgi:preprotein translocase subunit SecD
MNARELAKEWRIWVLVISLIMSTVLLVPWDSPTLFFDTKEDGDVGFQTNLENRTSIDFSGGTRMLLALESNATDQQLEDQAESVRQTLEIRLSNLDIPDPSVRVVDIGNGQYRIQVEASVGDEAQLRNVLEREGSFEARMPIPVTDEKNFSLADNTYSFRLVNRSVETSGPGVSRTLEVGDRFQASENGIDNYNTTFVYRAYNESTSTAQMEVVAYSGQDIKSVVDSDSRITGNGPYSFSFPVVISTASANNVLHVSQNYESSGLGTQDPDLTLENGQFARLGLYVDGERQTALRMSSVFAQQVVTQPSIQGGGQTHSEAESEMEELQVILESGSLEVPVEVVSTSTLSAARGSQFMTAAVLSIIGSLIAVGFAVFARYRDPRVVLPIVFTGASEVYILLGAYFTTFGTLSLSAVAGIIAAVGTGVDDQIIITDESGKQNLGGWKQKMKRAFFVIFTSAASTIGAMAPILSPSGVSLLIGVTGVSLIGYTLYKRGTNRHFVAIGVFAALVAAVTTGLGPSGAALSTIHEFARTTILGILVGIAITRPAFAKTIEYIKD